LVYVVNKIGIRKANKRTPKTIAPLGKGRSWLDRTELRKLEQYGIELGGSEGYLSRTVTNTPVCMVDCRRWKGPVCSRRGVGGCIINTRDLDLLSHMPMFGHSK
jgi:hypothetical protein